MAVDEVVKKVVDYEKLDVIDFLRSGACVVPFILFLLGKPATWDLKNWMMLDTFVTAGMGLVAFFCPEGYLSYQVDGKIDMMHQFFTQGAALMIIGLAVGRWYAMDSRDNACHRAGALSRFLGGLVFLVMSVYSHFAMQGQKQKMSVQHMSFGVVGCVTYTAFQTVCYFRIPQEPVARGGRGRAAASSNDGNRDIYLFLNVLILIPLAIMHNAFPDASLSGITMKGFTADGVHQYLVRCVGCWCLTYGLHFLAALNFDSEEDKKNAFIPLMLVEAIAVPSMLLYQWKYDMGKQFLGAPAMSAVVLLINYLGYCGGKCDICACCLNFFKSKRE